MRNSLLSVLIAGAAVGVCAFAQTEELAPAPQNASGVVFHDANGNGVRDEGEEGLAGVRVSNGREVILTNQEGRYELPVDDDTILFVVKPRNWMTPVDGDNLPRFYYIHKPAGSPKTHFPGVEPTGPLPASVDFPLVPRAEPDSFKLLLFGDTQPRDVKEVEYIAHDVIEEVVAAGAHGAALGVTLGDIVFNDLSVIEPLKKVVGLVGIPWYNVLGNHDMNFDADDDKYSDETFERHYGPSYYSFDHGPVHFVVLDDVIWLPDGAEPAKNAAKAKAKPKQKQKQKGRYVGGLGEKQLEFLRNDLSATPKDQLVVLMMHIPLNTIQPQDREAVYRLLEERPRSLSLAAHTHTQTHRFLGEADGFRGAEPHHLLVHATVCGSWWSGAPDETGIPHATMADGAPNGYSVITFDPGRYDIQFHAARRGPDYQMNIHAPEETTADLAPAVDVVVNVFAGSERSTVEMRLGDSGPWRPMTRTHAEDPYFLDMKTLEDGPTPPPGRKLPVPKKSPHVWKAKLAAEPPSPGTYFIHVRTTDMFGKTHADQRAIRITETAQP